MNQKYYFLLNNKRDSALMGSISGINQWLGETNSLQLTSCANWGKSLHFSVSRRGLGSLSLSALCFPMVLPLFCFWSFWGAIHWLSDQEGLSLHSTPSSRLVAVGEGVLLCMALCTRNYTWHSTYIILLKPFHNNMKWVLFYFHCGDEETKLQRH